MDTKTGVKVEGEAFERIKDKVAAKKEANEEARRIAKEANESLWNAIHEEFPDLDKKARLMLDAEYEDLGFYVVKDDSGSGLLGILRASLAE